VTKVTAEPIDPGALPWSPDPFRQRMADFTIEDVLALPDDAPRVELVDGVMLVVPSPSLDHQGIANLLWLWLRNNCPKQYDSATAVGVVVTPNNSCEPDVVLHRAEAPRKRHYLLPDEVALVVEVVSPGTRRRDRMQKPAIYADAGIPFFWRIEQDPVRVYAYRLDNGVYREQADSADELLLDEPFPIRLPISAITP
jgi:Uma2 family endonuclease